MRAKRIRDQKTQAEATPSYNRDAKRPHARRICTLRMAFIHNGCYANIYKAGSVAPMDESLLKKDITPSSQKQALLRQCTIPCSRQSRVHSIYNTGSTWQYYNSEQPTLLMHRAKDDLLGGQRPLSGGQLCYSAWPRPDPDPVCSDRLHMKILSIFSPNSNENLALYPTSHPSELAPEEAATGSQSTDRHCIVRPLGPGPLSSQLLSASPVATRLGCLGPATRGHE